jgi:hypothetical protein
MGNMSYCRFENTYGDLEDCKNALDSKGMAEVIAGASSYEKPMIRELIDLCKEIADEYYDELDDAYDRAEELELEDEDEDY